jgi:hypothetical protein
MVPAAVVGVAVVAFMGAGSSRAAVGAVLEVEQGAFTVGGLHPGSTEKEGVSRGKRRDGGPQ